MIEAREGGEALERVAGAGELNLLVTVIVMPGMSGRDLARGLRRDRVDLKALFTSGFGGREPEPERNEALLAEAFTPSEPPTAIRQVLD